MTQVVKNALRIVKEREKEANRKAKEAAIGAFNAELDEFIITNKNTLNRQFVSKPLQSSDFSFVMDYIEELERESGNTNFSRNGLFRNNNDGTSCIVLSMLGG